MHEIRKIRRENMDKEVRRQLMREDEREERELRAYVAQSLASEMINSLPGTNQRADEVKNPADRQQEASVPWYGQQHMDQSGGRR